ncbi:hypothetical protein AJ88_08855 [Mesorhizobium amorphae CCBAU 01583]|nr:hypothetical protein AJ88_08855 [Mesorhizobium amorphae CCBAU 01583]
MPPGEGNCLMRKPRATAATSGPDGPAPAGDVAAIVAGTHGDPFAVLGVHEAGKGFVARCFVPHAEFVTAYTLTGKNAGELSRRDDGGFFEGKLRSRNASRCAITPGMPAATGG